MSQINKANIIPNQTIYLNYASTSFPKSKIALDSFFNAINLLPRGSRQNLPSSDLEEYRMRVGKILLLPSENIFFTSSATIGLNQVIQGFIEENSCLAIDNRSHNSIVRPWLALSKKCHCILSNLYEDGDQFNEYQLLKTLSHSPQLFCLTHVNNVNGSVYPTEKIIDLIQKTSPITSILVDASQSAGAINLSNLKNADFIVFPSHKHLHSIPGAAVLVAKKRLKPIIFGGTGINSISEETLGIHENFAEVGTLNIPAIHALVDSLEYSETTMQEHRELEQKLVAQFLEGVQHIEGLKLIGRPSLTDRLGIIALNPEFGSPELHWTPFLRSQGIIIRGGLQCSPLYHQQLGLSKSGTLRFSFGWETTSEHISKALESLKEFSIIAGKFFYDSVI